MSTALVGVPQASAEGRYSEAGYHRSAADAGRHITPREAILRGNDWTSKNAAYSRDGHHDDRHGTAYGADSGGFVSMAWHAIPIGGRGYTTATIGDVVEPISWRELGAGDAILLARDDSSTGQGHIALVVEPPSGGRLHTMEAVSAKFGTRDWTIRNLAEVKGAGYKPVRYVLLRGASGSKDSGGSSGSGEETGVDGGTSGTGGTGGTGGSGGGGSSGGSGGTGSTGGDGNVDDEDILAEIERQLPKPELKIQPENNVSLVNMDTIFYVEPNEYHTYSNFDGGSRLQICAQVVSQTYHFGDGATKRTNDPGRPYPNQNIVHKYKKAGHYKPKVVLTWGNILYRKVGENGPEGNWQHANGDITVATADVDLELRENLPRS